MDAARPRVKSDLGEKLRDVKRPACFSVADRRVLKLRPSDSQPCRRRVESAGATEPLRPTVEDETQSPPRTRYGSALRSRCPADGAINPNRQTGVRRQKRSTPSRWTGARRVKDQRQTSTAGLGRGRRTGVNSVDSARAACEGPTSNSASAAFPRGRPFRSSRATGITHPGFYGRKPWKKPNSAPIIA